MTLRAFSAITINELKDFMEAGGISLSDLLFYSSNLSGAHDIVYRQRDDGAASVVSGSTAADRAVYGDQDVAKPLSATQFVAGGQTLTFAASTGRVTRSAGDFLADGYNPNMALMVAGTASNDGLYYISEVTATYIEIDSTADSAVYSTTLADEGPLGGGETLDAGQVGYDVSSAENLHIIVLLPDAGTSLDWSLYTWDSVSELWTLDTRIGTDGVASLAAADANNPERVIVELGGIEKVALVTSNLAGVFTAGYNTWMTKA